MRESRPGQSARHRRCIQHDLGSVAPAGVFLAHDRQAVRADIRHISNDWLSSAAIEFDPAADRFFDRGEAVLRQAARPLSAMEGDIFVIGTMKWRTDTGRRGVTPSTSIVPATGAMAAIRSDISAASR